MQALEPEVAGEAGGQEKAGPLQLAQEAAARASGRSEFSDRPIP